MNLQQITAGAVNAVNPMVPVTIKISDGTYTTGADFTRVPNYTVVTGVMAQIQALSFRDIMQVEGLNLQGTRRAIYLQGDVEGLVRSSSKGGDLIIMPDGTIWLVAMVLESWLQNTGSNDPGWCKVAVTLQNNS